MAMELEEVKTVLAGVVDPNTGKDLVSSRELSKVEISGGVVRVSVELGYPAASQIEPMRARIIEALRSAGAGEVQVEVH
ncbi:MAG TPA: iron-sulfur cluster assembly protein, partial [Burkholderiaceae bacterium]|nr:iron-sulfur cluster assembly protein [Burkholderiaceae bacterium]